MSFVRIVCKRPRGDNFRLPDIGDVHVYAVRADGTEEEILDVQAVSFKASADGEPVTACIRVLAPEIDAEAERLP